MFLIYYGTGQFDFIKQSFMWPVLREAYWCAIIAMTLNTGAYTSEIIRGGIESVPWGQVEAAKACGMNAWLRFRRVVFPLAIRSEEHTSELQSLMRISYAVFCLKKKNTPTHQP